MMTLITTDVDRVCGFVRHIVSLVGTSLTSKLDAPIEIFIGAMSL